MQLLFKLDYFLKHIKVSRPLPSPLSLHVYSLQPRKPPPLLVCHTPLLGAMSNIASAVYSIFWWIDNISVKLC